MNDTEKIISVALEMLSTAKDNNYKIVYLSKYLFDYIPLSLFVTITLNHKLVMIIDDNKLNLEYGFTKSDDLITDVNIFFE